MIKNRLQLGEKKAQRVPLSPFFPFASSQHHILSHPGSSHTHLSFGILKVYKNPNQQGSGRRLQTALQTLSHHFFSWWFQGLFKPTFLPVIHWLLPHLLGLSESQVSSTGCVCGSSRSAIHLIHLIPLTMSQKKISWLLLYAAVKRGRG